MASHDSLDGIQISVLASTTLYSLISLSHSSSCSHYYLKTSAILQPKSSLYYMILAAPNQYSGSCQPHPNVRPNAFHSMPFFLCCLEGNLVHPSPSTEQATFCIKLSQSKIIPLPTPRFLQHLLRLLSGQSSFPCIRGFLPSVVIRPWGSVHSHTHLSIHVPTCPHTALDAAFNKGLLSELTFM